MQSTIILRDFALTCVLIGLIEGVAPPQTVIVVPSNFENVLPLNGSVTVCRMSRKIEIAVLAIILTLGIFWVGQQTQLNHFARADRDLTWIHIGFLAAVSLMPFSTALLGHFITYRIALVVYWLNMLLLGVGLYGSWVYASRAGLLKPGVSEEISRVTKSRILVFQALYVGCVLLSVFNTYWSIASLLLLQLFSALSPVILRFVPFRRRVPGKLERR